MAKAKKGSSRDRGQLMAPVILALIVLGIGWLGISRLSKSHAAAAGVLCADFGKSQCVSPAAGNASLEGASVSVLSADNAWHWYEKPLGTVTSSGPFTTGWLNRQYKNRQVVQFQLRTDTGYCMASIGGSVIISACKDSRSQKWVLSGIELVNVSDSDEHTAKYVLTKANLLAITSQDKTYSAADQHWGFESK